MAPVQTPMRTDEKQGFVAIFAIFLKLGLTSFGGPAAHLGYFRNEFVLRRRWLDEEAYADLLALCQFLPGPASSQLGFCLGLLRGGGLAGGCAAWLGFTLPSALILFGFALVSGSAAFGGPLAAGVIHGLKLVAVAIVAHALWGMARALTPDRRRAGIALGALAIVLWAGGSFGQVAAIGAGALAGCWLCRTASVASAYHPAYRVGRRAGMGALALFAGLLLVTSVLGGAGAVPGLALFDACYHAGALVFGGGHVVLPLLRAELVDPGWVAGDRFLAGYAVAQAVPGPLFTFAAYLGAIAGGPAHAAGGALIALCAIFLPGLLLVYGALPFWNRWRVWPAGASAMRGANAAVVGILATALYDPVWTGAVADGKDAALALGGFLLLTIWKLPPWALVLLLVMCGGLMGWTG
jgi:chromate transporter